MGIVVISYLSTYNALNRSPLCIKLVDIYLSSNFDTNKNVIHSLALFSSSGTFTVWSVATIILKSLRLELYSLGYVREDAAQTNVRLMRSCMI